MTKEVYYILLRRAFTDLVFIFVYKNINEGKPNIYFKNKLITVMGSKNFIY